MKINEFIKAYRPMIAGVMIALAVLVGSGIAVTLSMPASPNDAGDDTVVTDDSTSADDATTVTDLTDDGVAAVCTGAMAFDGTDVSVPAADTVAVTSGNGEVMVVETVADTSDLGSVVGNTARRAAVVANTIADGTVDGKTVTDVTWVANDASGSTVVAVSDVPAAAPASGDTVTVLNGSIGHTMSDAAYAAIGGDASGTTATGGATVVTPAGDTIVPGSSAAADASADAGATTATGGSSATSASTGSSGSTSTATSTSGGSSTANGTSTSGTSGSSSSASGSGSSDSSPASSGGPSSTTPSGRWETESYVVTAGYYRTVTDVAAYDETVVDTPASTTTEYVCSDGTVFSSSQYSELQAYVKAQVLAGNSCTWSQKTVTTPAVTHVVHHDAVTHQEWVPEVDGTRQVWVTD